MARRIAGSVISIVALLLALPALAPGASSKPTVTTGGVAKLGPQSVSLLGKIKPNGAATTYLFQYGPTTIYGQSTAVQSAGSGTATIDVVADVGGLQPATTYHYRLVARNRNGTVNGADKTFKTQVLPLGLSLTATPNPVPFGQPTILAGALSGTGNAGRAVALMGNPFPYTQGFLQVGNQQITAADGSFSFPLLSVPINTQYRVEIPGKPEVSSAIVGVGVQIRVGTNVSSTTVRRNRRVRFTGTVRPARPGALVAIQKERAGQWVTVAGTITHAATPDYSTYSKRIRVRSSGNYRVFVAINDGNFVANTGRVVGITAKRKHKR